MNNDKTKLDSMTPNIENEEIAITTESAEPNIELIAKINAGQRIGTPNVTNSQDKKPDFTPPTFTPKDQ